MISKNNQAQSKYFFKILLSLICSFWASHFAYAINGIATFGDSLTDSGKTSQKLGGLPVLSGLFKIPNEQYYHDGRFSNGRVWPEFLAEDLKLPLENEAMGAAESLNDAVKIPFFYPDGIVLSMHHQVTAYVTKSGRHVDPDKLYILWIGGNDYLRSNQRDHRNIVYSNIEAINALTHAGANNILVMNLPNLTQTPTFIENGTEWKEDELISIVNAHNRELADAINDWNSFQVADETPAKRVMLYDIAKEFQNVIADPAAYGFKNVKDRCYKGGYIFPFSKSDSLVSEVLTIITQELRKGANLVHTDEVCENPDDHFFWDAIHPTTRGHHMLAGKISEFIKRNYF